MPLPRVGACGEGRQVAGSTVTHFHHSTYFLSLVFEPIIRSFDLRKRTSWKPHDRLSPDGLMPLPRIGTCGEGRHIACPVGRQARTALHLVQ
jgi:hypothetical protein